MLILLQGRAHRARTAVGRLYFYTKLSFYSTFKQPDFRGDKSAGVVKRASGPFNDGTDRAARWRVLACAHRVQTAVTPFAFYNTFSCQKTLLSSEETGQLSGATVRLSTVRLYPG